MKGCFISDACNRTECIADSPPKSNINYCCCHGNMCNLKYKYVPLPPAPAELEGSLSITLKNEIFNENVVNDTENSIQFTPEVVIPAPPSDKPTENLIIVIVACCAVVTVLISVGGIFFYRSRKTAMFNEVPTVKRMKFPSQNQLMEMAIWVECHICLFVVFRMNPTYPARH